MHISLCLVLGVSRQILASIMMLTHQEMLLVGHRCRCLIKLHMGKLPLPLSL